LDGRGQPGSSGVRVDSKGKIVRDARSVVEWSRICPIDRRKVRMAKQEAVKAMGLEVATSQGSGVTLSASAPGVALPNGRDADGRPYCGKHNALMVAYKTEDKVTRYKCQVDGCGETEKRIRSEVFVPAKPLLCSRAACAANGAVLAVDPDLSRPGAAHLTMRCPSCEGVQYVPRPGYRPAPASAPAPDFADR
jgi:hypothetical protein